MMEGGPLSDAAFAAFSKDVVAFCHISSRVAADKHQNLLQEKGGNGWPFVVFMDDAGTVLTEQQERTVDAFRATLASLTTYRELKAKAAAGDESVGTDLLLAELRLGLVSFADAKTRATKLEGLTEEQSKEIGQLLVNREFESIMRIRTREEAAQAFDKIQAMFEAKRIPHGKNAQLMLYDMLLRKADNDADPELFATALGELEKLLGDDENYAETLELLEAKLDGLRANAQAKKKATDGKDGGR